MHWCHHEKSWFTGSVVLNSPFLEKVTVVSRRPRETAQQTFILHCLKRGFVGCSGCPLFQKLPFVSGSPWASNKPCKVRIFRKNRSQLQWITNVKVKFNQSTLSDWKRNWWTFGWKFQPDTLELIVSWASSPSVPCIHSSTRIRCSMASHSHNGKPTSIQRLDHMFRCNLKVT